MDGQKVRINMSKKRISRKCINCKNCSAPSIIEKRGIRRIVYRCEAGIYLRETIYGVKEELLIDDRTEINCVKFSRK